MEKFGNFVRDERMNSSGKQPLNLPKSVYVPDFHLFIWQFYIVVEMDIENHPHFCCPPVCFPMFDVEKSSVFTARRLMTETSRLFPALDSTNSVRETRRSPNWGGVSQKTCLGELVGFGEGNRDTVRTHSLLYIYTYTYPYRYPCTCTYRYRYRYRYRHRYVYVYVYTYTYRYIYIYIYIYIYRYIYIYLQNQKLEISKQSAGVLDGEKTIHSCK